MPPLGLGKEWFRSSNGTKNETRQDAKVSDEHSPGGFGGRPLISREEMEIEYLNEISKLARETEEARDEIERSKKESESLNTSLRESNESLRSRVEELEAQLRSTPTEAYQDSSGDFVSELRSEEVKKMKAKLERYNESNKALSAKVQKLRDRVAQRRKDEDDDFSEVSSVGSLSILSSQMSTMSAASRISNRQHFAHLKNLQMKYDSELAKNKELEEKLHSVERSRETSENLLDELKLTSTERIKQHNEQMEKLRRDFAEAKEALTKLQDKSEENLRDGGDTGSSAELEKSRLKIVELEEEIEERKKEIDQLNSQLKEMSEMREKFQELNNTVIQLEKDLRQKSAEIETLQREKEESLTKLQLIESAMEENKAKSAKAQEELESPHLSSSTPSDNSEEIRTTKLELDKSRLTIQNLEQTILQLREEISAMEKLKVPDTKEKSGEEPSNKQTMMQESRAKIDALEKEMNKMKEETELKAKLDELQRKYTDEVKVNSSLKEQLAKLSKKEENSDAVGNDSTTKSESQSNLVREKEEEIVRLKDESSRKEAVLTKEIAALKTEIQSKEEKINQTSEEMKKLSEERASASSALEGIEAMLVETKLKNAQYMEDLQDIQTKYLEEKKRCSELEQDIGSTPGDESKKMKRLSHQHQEDLKKIKELQATISTKEKEIKDLGSKSRDLLRITEKVDKLEKDLGDKTEELNKIKNEKNQSIQKLEILELDFAVTQQKSAKTWEELEDLKEKYQNERRQKDDLQKQLREMDSAEKLINDAKKLSDAALKEKDHEIDKIKKQLTEANVARGATEKKLIGVMNDSVAQENEKEQMRLELEEQLEMENENAKKLEDQIKAKEDDIEQVRENFKKLIGNMNGEMDKKRNEITELHGEVLVKANLLAKRERDIEHMKSEMDDLKLKHSSEVRDLRRELDASVDKVELERLRKYNSDLEYNITSLNQEIGKLRLMFVHQPSGEISAEGTVQILRSRNKKLMKDVEKLTQKLRQAKELARQEI